MMTQLVNERELKLTAALYTLKNGVLDHVKRTGTLPEHIPTGGSEIAMRLLIERRGTDITLDADEKLVFRAVVQAVLESKRLPGGSVQLIEDQDLGVTGDDATGQA
jgi:hypothetical protein